MSEYIELQVAEQVEPGLFELRSRKLHVKQIIGLTDWSAIHDEDLEAYGIDYEGAITEVTLLNGECLLVTSPLTTICDLIKDKMDGLRYAIIEYIAKKRLDEAEDESLEFELSGDYAQGLHDGTIMTLNDIEEILKR